MDLFLKGGPVMWPLLVTSLVALTVIFERLYFSLREYLHRDDAGAARMFAALERGDFRAARIAAVRSPGVQARFAARVLQHCGGSGAASFNNAVLSAAASELRWYNRGIAVLDTVVTLAPLEGLFGTVTGMIHAFGLLGASELGAPTAITGGIAEALIATAFGLSIAMVSLLPFNFLTARLERVRAELEAVALRMEACWPSALKREDGCTGEEREEAVA